MSSILSIFWDIQNSSKHTGVPTVLPPSNTLDAHGAFFDLPRLPGESGTSYFKRLQSVIPLRAGSDYEGLVHGTTRELGLEEQTGLKISPVASAGEGAWLAVAPHVEVTSTQVILYSEYYADDDYVVDKTIDIFSHGSGYLLSDLVSEINTSGYFLAELGSGVTGNEKSNGLFAGSSTVIIEREWVPASTYFLLEHTDIIPGTLSFTEKTVFQTEISPALVTPLSTGITLAWSVTTPVSSPGEYNVNYEEAIVTSSTSASGRGTARYIYRNFPWRLRWSPVAVYSLRDQDYRTKIFETETMPDGTSRQGLVTSEGSEVYNQIFDKSTCLWGK